MKIRCQKISQRERLKRWRERNPDYFSGEYRKKSTFEKWKKQKLNWQKRHRGYFKMWRETNREKYNIYMRGYMRKWRELNKW